MGDGHALHKNRKRRADRRAKDAAHKTPDGSVFGNTAHSAGVLYDDDYRAARQEFRHRRKNDRRNQKRIYSNRASNSNLT